MLLIPSNNSPIWFIIFFPIIFARNYHKERDVIIRKEELQMLGAQIKLNEKEVCANTILMKHKFRDYEEGLKNPKRHFFELRRDIEKSKVFKYLQKLPKGASLHVHDFGMVSQKFLYKLTFKDNLYACTSKGRLKLKFFKHVWDKTCNWTLVSVLRKSDPSYSKWLESQMTLEVRNPRERYTSRRSVWDAFKRIVETIEGLITYKAVFKEHFYQTLKELYEDNVIYLEFRTPLPPVYNLDGKTYKPLDTATFYQEVINQFKKDHPKFFGVRFIYSPNRNVNTSTLHDDVEITKSLKRLYPDLLAGFDLVGYEDIEPPLIDFMPQLETMAAYGIHFYFHSGETNWYGMNGDINLLDAVLLGSKRIGHGYALNKHPVILDIVDERKIAIEICPISNLVFLLVDDIRNHPAVGLLADGYQLVVGNDYPSFWGTKGLSYDFYMTFMGIASRHADLKLLKQLARNSLVYSGMSEVETEFAKETWKKQWENFIEQMVTEKPCSFVHLKDYGNSVRVGSLYVLIVCWLIVLF